MRAATDQEAVRGFQEVAWAGFDNSHDARDKEEGTALTDRCF